MAALASRPADEEELTFEQALARLEEAVVRLESGELTLDEALATFEQGVRMARLCSRRLEQAEARLYMLLEREGGELAAVPFEPGAGRSGSPGAGSGSEAAGGDSPGARSAGGEPAPGSRGG